MTTSRTLGRLVSTTAAAATAAILLAGCGPTASTGAANGASGRTSTSVVQTSAKTKPGTAAPTAAHTTGHVAAEVAATTTMLTTIPVGGRGPKTGYNRVGEFGPAWVDVDGNGCGTRDDVLARDLSHVGKRNRCVVISGTLHEPYTGKTVTFAKANAVAVQIDHVVPLSLAHQLGAAQWPRGEAVSFANDPANLLAVDGQANEDKSDSGPDSWLPPNKAYRCTYVIHFTRVISLYHLRLTAPMKAAIVAQLNTCSTVVGDPAHLAALPTADWPRAARFGTTTVAVPAGETPAPVPSTSGNGDVYYANCAAVRAAGKAPLHRTDPGFRAALDANHDGVACS